MARRHGASRYAISHEAGPILFEDTEELMTSVWSEMLLGEETPSVEALITAPDVYILYGSDTPWEEDTLRYFAKTELRQDFFDRIERKLKKYNLPYLVINGEWEKRERETIAQVEALLAATFIWR